MFRRTLAALCLASVAVPVAGATLSTFATQAIEVALLRLASQYRAQTGHEVTIRFDTSPGLGRRVAAGESADVLVAAASVVDQAITTGRVVASTRRDIGRIALGVATRRGAPQPDIRSVDALEAALGKADTVLFSQGTSGLYIEKMLARLRLDVALTGKAVQVPSAALALGRLAQGTGNDIAFATTSEIRANESKGVSLVGPLPRAVQNYTTYAAAVMTGSPAGEIAREFVRFITTASARDVMASTGWEPVPEARAQP
jgi:molybdate transport system substrate-binding protein